MLVELTGVAGAKADTSDTVDVFNIGVCELAGHLPTYSQYCRHSLSLSTTHYPLQSVHSVLYYVPIATFCCTMSSQSTNMTDRQTDTSILLVR